MFLQLGEVTEIEAQMFSFVLRFNRRTELEFSTGPAIFVVDVFEIFVRRKVVGYFLVVFVIQNPLVKLHIGF